MQDLCTRINNINNMETNKIVGRPWISKHFKSSMGSAMRMDHDGSPMSRHDGKEFGDDGFMDTHFQSGKPRNAAPEQKYNAAAEKHCMGKKH